MRRLIVLPLLLLVACATPQNNYDPLESINRPIFAVNKAVDDAVVRPVSQGYVRFVPPSLRKGVDNFFENIDDLFAIPAALLQGKATPASQSFGRALVNTTLGVGGLWDPATAMGLPRQSEDFGQTLGFYGVPGGAYLMLPILGPSNLRDTTGLVVDYGAAQEINFLNVPHESTRHPEIWVLGAIDKRYNTSFRYGQFDSPFEYDKLRYIYTEARKLQIAE